MGNKKYDLRLMEYKPDVSELRSKFLWRHTPQGHMFWREFNDHRTGHDKAVTYLGEMYKQYLDEQDERQHKLEHDKPQRSTKMDKSYNIFLINDQVRAVKCAYEKGDNNQQLYTFKTMIQDLEVDDYVIVQTGTRHGMTVVQVKELDVEPDLETGPPLKWIVGRVNVKQFDELLEKEKEANSAIAKAENRKKRNDLRDALIKDQEETIAELELASSNMLEAPPKTATEAAATKDDTADK